MTYLMLAGCALIAFGPALALFWIFLAQSAQLVVLMVGSSFFWLLSILMTSIVWYVFVPLRTHYWFIVPFAVLLQEAMRWTFYKLYAKAQKAFTVGSSPNTPIPHSLDYFAASLAIGLGFGFTHAMVMYGSVLADSYGPGSLYAPACTSVSLFLLSAVFALAFISMHVLLSVLSFDAYKATEWRPFLIKAGVMAGGHLVISLLTLLNQEGGSCVASAVLVYLVLAVLALFTARVAFTSPHLLLRKYSPLSH